MAGVTRSRRKLNTKVEVPEEVKYLTSCYCRRCMQNKRATEFYEASDKELDKNGKMSICKACVDNMYQKFYVDDLNFSNAIYQTCKIMNVKFDPIVVETAQKHIETSNAKGKAINQQFGTYMAKLRASEFGRKDNNVEDFTFHENVKYDAPGIDPEVYGEETVQKLEEFWGRGMTPDQYQFLESEMARYKKTHRSDTAAEISLLRQICFAELDIREARQSNNSSPASAIDMLQKLMKTANVDPAKAAVAQAGKSQDTFSSFVKIIEENEPADYYKDKKLFKDFDNLEFYLEKYVTRPLSNFLKVTRDFNVGQNQDDPDDMNDPFGVLEEGGD